MEPGVEQEQEVKMVVVEQLDLARTGSISPTSTSDSTEVDCFITASYCIAMSRLLKTGTKKRNYFTAFYIHSPFPNLGEKEKAGISICFDLRLK